MHIILVTDRSRPKQLEQTCQTVVGNAAHWEHNLHVEYDVEPRRGIGGCRNDAVEALGKPEDGLLMFLDGDFYMLPGWDRALIGAYRAFEAEVPQLAGWCHPFNRPERHLFRGTHCVFTVCAAAGGCQVMNWATWKRFGPWKAGAVGPGQSEDWEYSQRIRGAGLEVGCVWPFVGIHTGLIDSSGKPVVGHDLLVADVEKQIEAHRIRDIVLEG